MADILVVDDDESVVSAFRAFLAHEGHQCRIAGTAADALIQVRTQRPDLVITDVRMPGIDGLEGLRMMREIAPGLPVIVMTAHGTSRTSIEAMLLGAFDYLAKPFELADLRALIARVVSAIKAPHAGEPEGAWERYDVELVGQNPRMVEVYKMVGLLAGNDVPPLIVGERGTGKQLIARTIHQNSARKEEPFLAIDARSLPESMLEPELTRAMQMAVSGSLYVGSIDALPLSAQVQLTRAFAGRVRDGQRKPRLIAASDRELNELVSAGKFSSELYELIGVIIVRLPPLREHVDDIPALAEHFVRRFNSELGRSIAGLDPDALSRLRSHHWPGNIAELELTVKRACILARGDVITAADLSLDRDEAQGQAAAQSALEGTVRAALRRRLSEGGASGSPYHDLVDAVEEVIVSEALAITGGNQLRAAEMLGVNRATLRKKIPSES
jgi:DNA-binding NtrC family response regulator